jgi:hypothetical protein
MFRSISKSFSVNLKLANSLNRKIPVRCFGDKLSIPTDEEQQGGRRKEEIDATAAGDVGFNEDPIIPAADAGTKENPILVCSKN